MSYSRGFWGKFVLAPVLIAVPPALLLAFSKASASEQSLLPSDLVLFLKTHPGLSALAATAWVILLKGIHEAIEMCSKPDREISREDLNALIVQQHNLLETRIQRMSKKLPKPNLATALNCEQQVIATLAAIGGFYSMVLPSGGKYRVHLLKVAGGKPVMWEANWPADKPPRTTAEQLASSESTAMATIKSQRIQMVERTKAETKGLLSFAKSKTPYFHNDLSKDEKGSLICYPIVSPVSKEVVYVLSVVAEAQGTFLKKDDDLHGWWLEKFGKLLQLEIAIAEQCSKGPS